MLNITIFWTSLSLNVLGSRSQRLFLEKNIPSFIIQFGIWYEYTSYKFAFQHDRVKFKVAVTIFRKILQLKTCQVSKEN